MARRFVVGLWPILLLALATRPAAAQLRTQVVAQGLSNPVAFLPDPTSASRFFIVEQGGLIRLLDNGLLTTFLDLRPPAIRYGGEEGLLGMAFAPDAATSGRFFVNFTSPEGNIVVARFRRSPADAPTAAPASRFDLIWPGQTPYIPHPGAGNHNGGNLAFGPDGCLYVGTGDGGGGNDESNNAQNPRSLLGKMLRIDVNVADAHPTGYTIPPGNPFVDGQPIAALHEIWSFGLRNPWRYSFDDLGAGATGALVIGDVGQSAREEANYEPAGAGGRNYGWSMREGLIATPGVSALKRPAYLPLTNPLFEYPRTIGRAITGGYVYRGTELPAAYRGRYFVGDSSTSVVGSIGIRLDPATGEATFADAVDHTAELGGALGGVVSFGRDLAGELYVLTFAGRVLKIVAADGPAAPTNLSASVSGRTVSLDWLAPAVGAPPTGYRIEAGASPAASNVTVLQTGPETVLTVTDVPDGIYFVRARSLRDSRISTSSNEVRVAVGCAAAPPPPTDLVHSVNRNQVTLSWAASAGATRYLLEAGSASGLANIEVLPVGPFPAVSVNAPRGVYFVRLRGVNGCGVSAASNEVLVTVS